MSNLQKTSKNWVELHWLNRLWKWHWTQTLGHERSGSPVRHQIMYTFIYIPKLHIFGCTMKSFNLFIFSICKFLFVEAKQIYTLHCCLYLPFFHLCYNAGMGVSPPPWLGHTSTMHTRLSILYLWCECNWMGLWGGAPGRVPWGCLKNHKLALNKLNYCMQQKKWLTNSLIANHDLPNKLIFNASD